MSLLDADSKKLQEFDERKKAGQKPTSTGVNRFKSLNRFSHLTEQLRKKEPDTSVNDKVGGQLQIKPTDVLNDKRSSKPQELAPLTPIAVQIEKLVTQKGDATSQNEERTEFKGRSIGVQTEFRQSSIGNTSEIKASSIEIQTESKQVSKQSPKQNRESLNSEQIETHVGMLTGLQKQTLTLLYIFCKQQGNRVIGPITRDQLAAQLSIHKENVKTVLYRLCKKGFIQRNGSKEGRGGFLKLEIPELVYVQLSQAEAAGKELHRTLYGTPQLISELSSQQVSAIPSSSNSEFKENKTTTTRAELSGEWSEVQIPPPVKDKLSVAVIFQCRDRALCSPKELQASLDAFAFDVVENKLLETKKIMSAQAFFMGSINKNRGYAKPSNFLSDEDKAEREMLERLEAEKRDRDSRKERIFELNFESWRENLTAAQIFEIVPEYARKPGPIQDSSLKLHFRNNVFGKETGDQSR